MFTPSDWYWFVGGDGWHKADADSTFTGDESRVYSSARLTYVPPSDPDYTAWKERVGSGYGIADPTNRIESEASLAEVLSHYGIVAEFGA